MQSILAMSPLFHEGLWADIGRINVLLIFFLHTALTLCLSLGPFMLLHLLSMSLLAFFFRFLLPLLFLSLRFLLSLHSFGIPLDSILFFLQCSRDGAARFQSTQARQSILIVS